MMKSGLVLEGGAMRGIFTAGVLDFLLEQNIYFDYVVGVSAGSGNALGFMSRQVGRTKKIIMHEDAQPYYGLEQLVENRKILNLETLVEEYALHDIPYDFETYDNSESEYEAVVANCETGLAEYHGDYRDRDEFFKYNMATCSVPFLCEPVEIRGYHYLDGSVIDSLPVARAVEKGCDKILVVLTKPEGNAPTDYSKMHKLINKKYGQYPKLCDALFGRMEAYSEQLDYMNKMVEEGRVMIVRPVVQLVHHFENSTDRLNICYQFGYDTMAAHYNEFLDFFELKKDKT